MVRRRVTMKKLPIEVMTACKACSMGGGFREMID